MQASAGLNGSISPAGDVEVKHGFGKSFTFIPAPGYSVDDVLVNGTSVGPVNIYTFENIRSDQTVHAVFVEDTSNTYPLIHSASGYEAGSPPENILGSDHGDSSRWSAEGFPQWVIIDYGEAKSITGTRLYTYSDRAYQYTVEMSGDLTFDGSVEVDRSANTSGDQPIIDNFTAVSARFVRLTIKGASGYTGSWASITGFEIVEDTSVVSYTITASAGANGSISPSGSVLVAQGDDQTFSITPDSGYEVADVFVSGNSVGAVSTYTFANVTATGSISATFKPVSTSYPVIHSVSEESDDAPAEGLIDGDFHATNADARWSADGMPQSVIIDYGENKSIIGTKLYTYKNRAYQYKVELSEDLDFSGDLVVDRLSNTSGGQPITDNFGAVTARYAKITVTGAAAYTGSWVSLIEFEIVEGTSNEIPEGYPVINSFSKEAGDGPATNLIDDNTDGVSRWAANTFPQWIIVDYGAVVPMTGTQVWTYQNRAYKYKVALSEDLDFTNDLVVDRLSNTEAGQPIADNFAAVNARYAKITVTGASGYSGTWCSLTEFKVLLDGGLMSTASSLPPVASATRISSDPAIVVYPNPTANGEFEIRGLEDGAIVTVHSLLGFKLIEKTVKGNSLKLNLANTWGYCACEYITKRRNNLA